MAKFTDLFDMDDKELAEKFLDYYDGDQKEYVEKELKRIRFHTFSSGMLAARFRNIVKMVVDKSGMLFSGKPPVMEVFVGDTVDEAQTARAQELFESAEWIEFFTNLDPAVRMLKTTMVLPYYISEEDRLAFTLLGPHNSGVLYDELSKKVLLLIYCTGETDKGETYRVISPELYQDIEVDETTGAETITSVEPNPYGVVITAAFHDTNTPREGFFNEIPEDLIGMNDIYNIALSDSEYSAAWGKLETLFTNATVEGEQGGAMVPTQIDGEALPRMRPAMGAAAIGGPGKVIQINTDGVQAPFVEYKGPKPNLQPLDAMVQSWVIDFAGDWNVNAKMDQNGADSGFKLLVKEMPNLELRKKRQRMMEAGFKRLFKSVKTVVNFAKPNTFSDDAELYIHFGAPDLPVDEKATEEVWNLRIAANRATRVDYFMAVQGLSKPEAEKKVAEIDATNAPVVAPVVAAVPPVAQKMPPVAPM
jgi:hypothetical protein